MHGAIGSASTQTGFGANLKDIDVLRGLAAVLVLGLHTREVTWIGMHKFWQLHGLALTPGVMLGYATFPLVWGSIGVPIFFVLSGYCIHRSQAFAHAATGSFQLRTAHFLARRFLRIYPVLFGALMLTLACDWLSRHYLPNSDKLGDTGLYAYFVNLLSLQGIAGRPYGSNGPLWTLSIEVQFYALYPVLLTVLSRLGKMPTLGILALVTAVSSFALQRYDYQLFSSYYLSWYLGVLVAEGEASGRLGNWLNAPQVRAVLHLSGLGLLGLGCGLFFLSQYLAFQFWAVAAAIALVAVLRRRAELQGRLAKLLRWLGSFSFSLYIIHLPFIVLIQSVLFHSVHQESIAFGCVALGAAIVFAYLFSLVFERPALALSRRLKDHWPAAQAFLTPPSGGMLGTAGLR